MSRLKWVKEDRLAAVAAAFNTAMKTRNSCSFRLRSVLRARKAAVYNRRPSAVPMPRPSNVPNMKSAAKPLATRASRGIFPCLHQQGGKDGRGALLMVLMQGDGGSGRSGRVEGGSVMRKGGIGAEQQPLRGERGAVRLCLNVIAEVSSGDVRQRVGLGRKDGRAAWKRIVFSAGGRIAWHE